MDEFERVEREAEEIRRDDRRLQEERFAERLTPLPGKPIYIGTPKGPVPRPLLNIFEAFTFEDDEE